MNWKKGFLRIWAVLSVLWIILIFALVEVPQNTISVFNYEEQHTDFKASDLELLTVINGIITVRHGARTWEINYGDISTPATPATPENPREQLAVHLNQKGMIHNARQRSRNSMLRDGLLLAFIPVTVLLLLGMAGFWVALGFRGAKQ